jgi:hypothetical protein
MHVIEEGREGLDLVVDGQTVAHLVDRGNNVDLVFAIRGPKNVDDARAIVLGLMDLIVHHDSMEKRPRKFTKR